jgi:putative ABC transport system permease protein
VPLPRLDAGAVGVDGRLLLFAIAAATLTSVAFGVVPAMLMARGDMQRPLKESGRGGDGSGTRRRARSLLVAAEVALAVILLVGAVLLGRSFQRLVQLDPGFQSTSVVTVNLDLPGSYRDFKKIAVFYDQLLTSLRTQPGVAAAGLANFLPLDAGWRMPFFVEGRPRPAAGDAPIAQHQSVDEDYFKIIGVPLSKGRFFDAHDTVDSQGVVIINEALARRQWPNEDPVGQQITTTARFIGPLGAVLMPPATRYQVVGVVANVRNASLTQPSEPAVYFTFRQFSFRGFALALKGTDPAALSAAVRTSVQRLDPNLPLSPARPLDRVIADATDRPRALMMLMGLFAALALGLAALGIYGTLSYAVNQRQQELSVRMALGARPRDVVWLVVRQGLALALVGAAIGVAGAFALGRTLSSLLFGVSAGDALAFAVALGVALTTAVGACLLPARRAAALDPLQGLRAE